MTSPPRACRAPAVPARTTARRRTSASTRASRAPPAGSSSTPSPPTRSAMPTRSYRRPVRRVRPERRHDGARSPGADEASLSLPPVRQFGSRAHRRAQGDAGVRDRGRHPAGRCRQDRGGPQEARRAGRGARIGHRRLTVIRRGPRARARAAYAILPLRPESGSSCTRAGRTEPSIEGDQPSVETCASTR